MNEPLRTDNICTTLTICRRSPADCHIGYCQSENWQKPMAASADTGHPTLPADMQHDREVMDQLLEGLRKHCHPVRHWFYGHYHHSWQADIDGIRYTMLREMEMKELR